MKRYTIEATDDNVLESIKKNTLNRNPDVREFVEFLETIEGNMFIGIDGKWGTGKSFYVREIEKTLEYLIKKKWKEEEAKELEKYFDGTILKEIDLDKSYLPIYYNAWLYDNHNDPLLSLMFSIVKQSQKYIDCKINDKSIGDKILSILSSISLNIKNIPISFDLEKIKETFSGEDILRDILTAEEVREKVKQILSELIIEEAQRLVIFVDELDRCRPDFAIEMLERIKHYFDDDRILFVISVNKEELTYTISKCYGNGFNSSDYLNRFFDFTMELPQVNTENYFQSLGISCAGSEWIKKIAYDLQKFYNLSIRNTAKLFYRVNAVYEKSEGYIYGTEATILIYVIVPIIYAMDLINVQEKNKLLNGEGKNLLKEVIPNLVNCRKLISKLADRSETSEEELFNVGLQEFIDMYEFTFKEGDPYEWYRRGDIRRNLKKTCIQLLNLN